MDRHHNHICGLYYISVGEWKRRYLPPVQLKSHTTINPVCFTTQLTQTFQNKISEALPQVRYTFPLYDGVAVNGYTISYGSKVLKGVVKQKDDAKKTYQVAVDRGETAGLLESLPAGVFGVTIGNVPANTDVVVDITYCGELKHDAGIDGLRYNLPTSIAPRYGNYPGEILNSTAVANGGFNITVDLDMAESAIKKVQSPSHPIAVSVGAISTAEGGDQAPFRPSQASATLTLGSAELADDFVLQVLVDNINKPRAILETHPTISNQRALMTTLVPKFTLEAAHPEIVFIADQSGSMSGAKNAALVSALKVFLKSLPIGVRFNICAFGNSNNFKFLFPKSQAYNEANLNTAMAFVDSFNAGYGGTEILKPIEEAFKLRLKDMPLEVMLLTDGEIWAEDVVFQFINEQIHEKGVDARVFGLGIGTDVSHTLVEGVARAGNGFAQFVTQNEDTGQKVIRMLKGALYAHTKDYSLEVNYDDREEKVEASDGDDDFEIVEKVNDCLKITDLPAEPKQGVVGKVKSFFDTSDDTDKPLKAEGDSTERYAHLPSIETPKLLQAPKSIPPLFPFNRTTLYLLLGPETSQKKVSSVTVRATGPDGPLELTVPVHYSDSTDLPTIHQLAARKAVQDMEEGRGWIQAAKDTDNVTVKKKYESRFDELIERECVRLGEKFQVVGKWTSFVAVEEKDGESMEVDEEEEGFEAQNVGIRDAVFASSSKKFKRSGGGTARYVDPSAIVVQSPTPFQAVGGLFSNVQNGSGSTGGGLFGNAQPEAGGLFGNTGTTSAPTATAFGTSSGSQTGSSGGLFGQPHPRNPGSNTGGSLFAGAGQIAGTGTGLFGRPENAMQTTGSSLFGNSQSSPKPFANNNQQSGGLFGQPRSQDQNDVKPTRLFGNTPSNTTGRNSSGNNLFGFMPNDGPLVDQRNDQWKAGYSAGFSAGYVAGGKAEQVTSRLFGAPANQDNNGRNNASGGLFGLGPSSTEPKPPSAHAKESTENPNHHIDSTPSLYANASDESVLTDDECRFRMTAHSHSATRDSVAPMMMSYTSGPPPPPPPPAQASAAPASFGAPPPPPYHAASAFGGSALAANYDPTIEDSDEDMGFALWDDGNPPPPSPLASNQPLTSATYVPGGEASGAAGVGARGPLPPPARKGRTNQPPRASTGGMAPRKQLASMAARKSAPVVDDEDDQDVSAPSSLSDTQKMHALINLQTFSGAWAWDAQLFAILGIDEGSVKKEELGGNEEVMATALAVAWLEKRVPAQKGVWEMVVEKAKGWMKGQSVDVEAVIGKAGGYF